MTVGTTAGGRGRPGADLLEDAGTAVPAQALRRWQALLPDARTVEHPAAGHFVQEEKGVEMVPEVRQFLADRRSAE